MQQSVHGGLHFTPLLRPHLQWPLQLGGSLLFSSFEAFWALYVVKIESLCFFNLFLQEKLYGKSIIISDREMVEEKADDMLVEAQTADVAFLVVGDPFG